MAPRGPSKGKTNSKKPKSTAPRDVPPPKGIDPKTLSLPDRYKKVIKAYVEEFRDGDKQARQTVINNAMNSMRDKYPKEFKDWNQDRYLVKRAVAQWFNNNGRKKETGPDHHFVSKYNKRLVAAQVRKADLDAFIAHHAPDVNLFSNWQQLLSAFLEEHVDADEMEGYAALAQEWSESGPPVEVQQKNADNRAVKYIKDFSKEMFRHCGMTLIVMSAHVNSKGMLCQAEHDYTNNLIPDKKGFTDTNPKWITEPDVADAFGKWAEFALNPEVQGYDDIDEEDVSIMEIKYDVDSGWPVLLPMDEWKLLDRTTQQKFIGGWLTAHYHISKGVNQGPVPWGDVWKSGTGYVKAEYLPDGWDTWHHPSKWTVKMMNKIYQHWIERIDDNKMPFRWSFWADTVRGKAVPKRALDPVPGQGPCTVLPGKNRPARPAASAPAVSHPTASAPAASASSTAKKPRKSRQRSPSEKSARSTPERSESSASDDWKPQSSGNSDEDEEQEQEQEQEQDPEEELEGEEEEEDFQKMMDLADIFGDESQEPVPMEEDDEEEHVPGPEESSPAPDGGNGRQGEEAGSDLEEDSHTGFEDLLQYVQGGTNGGGSDEDEDPVVTSRPRATNKGNSPRQAAPGTTPTPSRQLAVGTKSSGRPDHGRAASAVHSDSAAGAQPTRGIPPTVQERSRTPTPPPAPLSAIHGSFFEDDISMVEEEAGSEQDVQRLMAPNRSAGRPTTGNSPAVTGTSDANRMNYLRSLSMIKEYHDLLDAINSSKNSYPPRAMHLPEGWDTKWGGWSFQKEWLPKSLHTKESVRHVVEWIDEGTVSVGTPSGHADA
ncbi:hypothetical protein EWM64_g2717 [Hericium alpestre]|uniref:Uncharacterized protein n=1 Tax=Hericium alpestre TaxID=135208 RepID=A0A4Z0A4E8_9AGAM|nr:hypothetical protein EWM64_g2717 [Hericium alpestre]